MTTISFTQTNIHSENFSYSEKPKFEKTKIIISVLSVMTSLSYNNSIKTVKPEISVTASVKNNSQKVIIPKDEALTRSTGLNFTNSSEKDDIIRMNNDKLEVEDLADRVTQTQLDEIKSHFDTKISNLDDNIKLHIKGELQTTVTELKDYISEENNKLKEAKNNSLQFWISNAVVPVISVVATLLLTKWLGLY